MTDDKQLSIFHIDVKNNVNIDSVSDTDHFWKACLIFNGNIEINQGSWLSFYEKTNNLRLSTVVPKKFADGKLLENISKQLLSLSNNVVRHHLLQTDTDEPT